MPEVTGSFGVFDTLEFFSKSQTQKRAPFSSHPAIKMGVDKSCLKIFSFAILFVGL